MNRGPITLKSLDARVAALEMLASDVTKIKNLVKAYAPILIAVLVANEYIGEKFAGLMTAIVGV
jgi:hypothetical protein